MVKNSQMSEALRLFEVIDGGKKDEFPITKPDGSGGKSDDWLRSLGQDTRFLCRPRNNRSSVFDQYGIAGLIPEAVLLYSFGSVGFPFVWVDSSRFSKDNVFVAILPSSPEEERKNERNQSPSALRQGDDGHEGSGEDIPDA